MARCKACGAPIVWIKMVRGKSMPCDANHVYYIENRGAKDKIVTPNGLVLSCELTSTPDKATGVGYVPHWSTCPQADTFRRRGK